MHIILTFPYILITIFGQTLQRVMISVLCSYLCLILIYNCHFFLTYLCASSNNQIWTVCHYQAYVCKILIITDVSDHGRLTTPMLCVISQVLLMGIVKSNTTSFINDLTVSTRLIFILLTGRCSFFHVYCPEFYLHVQLRSFLFL